MNRLARRARDVVETWPRGGWAVGLLADPADTAWAGEAARSLIGAAAERRRPAFLLDLAPECSDLAARFDAVGAGGFGEAVAGDVRLPEVARRDEQDGVAFLPCGRRKEGAEMAGSGTLRAFADRVRGEGGVLLVVLDFPGAEAAAEAGWPDGWVLLGDPEAATGGRPLPGDLPEVGRIEPREERATGDDPPADSVDEAERWRRHRSSSSFPALKVGGAALLLAALSGAWWWYANRATGTSGPAGASPGPTAADVASPAAGSAAAGVANDPAPRGTAVASGDSARGQRLAYSVLIASYASFEDARQRARQLSDRSEEVFFVAPTPVRGSVWHRVYAGAVADRATGESLMGRLVEAGAKGEERAWDVRPVPWSFRIADGLEERSAAAVRVEELRSRGIPAYVVRGEGDYQVYSGAFESREAAGALRDRIGREGIEARLVRRVGEAR